MVGRLKNNGGMAVSVVTWERDGGVMTEINSCISKSFGGRLVDKEEKDRY